MSIKTDGTLFIFSSPSGAGKTTLVKLLEKKENFFISVSHTTRKPRSNEVNGRDYNFVSDEEFKNLIKKDQFLEHAKVFNNYYGTLKKPVMEKLNQGDNVLFDIDWQGTKQIKDKKINFKIISIFVLPPSKQVLYDRLSNRDMKDKLIASERMKEFYKDLKHWVDYDFVVINDDLEKCYQEISEIINDFQKFENSYLKKKIIIEKHVKKLLS
tara:strand:+ start:122 stop:757 length:636 start_codon:yes stop_codon:yes gene_type:complete